MVIVGIDEVGRGCWAGPLVACAVVLSRPLDGLKDSKLLTAKRRLELSQQIYDTANGVGIGVVDPGDIDISGITTAVKRAMEEALAQIHASYDEVIIDGSYNFLSDDVRVRTLVKADALIPAVSAASIVAKVWRDSFMAEQALLYPGYGFERHVGYGTKQHIAALQQYGPTPLHRMSFKPLALYA